ncbi:MAG: 6,7-dimethyl-8-ribityllumazine synthase [Candidatus Marinimicrobia bacterium]|nr:6,7-dimethyl-8-ribityllumazine synthase [Candidatus Neomarinimicrobiota bacterium]
MSSSSALGLNVVIVISEFNPVITESLLNGAMDAYITGGGKEENVKIYRVPGAYEIPGTVKQVMENQSPDAVVTLGAVIRGGTPHFDYVAGECARGVSELSMAYDVPIMFGVLTTDNLQQALERSGTKAGNKGWDVMEAAIQTASVYKDIQSQSN